MLDIGGATLNAGAPAGHGGTIYLDPYDLIVGSGTPQTPFDFETDSVGANSGDVTPGSISYIAPSTLVQASQGGAVNITLATQHDLTVQESVNLAQGFSSSGGAPSGAGGASLTLQAGHDLNVLANITLGNITPNFTTPTLSLSAGHNIFIGPVSGTPVTLTTFGTITVSTTGAIAAGDPFGSSITIHDNSVLTTGAGLVLQASNRVDVGSNVQISTGPSFGFSIGNASYTGINVSAGSDITVGTNSRLAVQTQVEGRAGLLQLDAGGNVSIGAGTALTATGSTPSSAVILAGDATPQSGNPNAVAPNTGATLTVSAGATLSGVSSFDIESGAGGSTTLAVGSSVQTNNFGNGFLFGGSGGISIAGTVSTGANGSLTLNSSGGAVIEPASGAIVTGTLVGVAGSYDLNGNGNQIGQIGPSFGDTLAATTGDVTVANSAPLLVGGNDSTGGGIQVTSGHTITLITDTLTIGPGLQFDPQNEASYSYSLYAPGGAIVIQPLTAARPVELVTGGATANTLSVNLGDLRSNALATRLQLGAANAGAVTLGTAGSPINLSSSIGGGTQFTELDLISGGAITQATGSPVTVNTLTANGVSVTLLETGNQISNLGASSASNGFFALADGSPLTVTGAVTDARPSTPTILLQADQLTIGAAGSLTSGIVQLTPLTTSRPIELVQTTSNPGRLSITQASLGRITANVLNVGAAGDTGGIAVGNAGDAISVSAPNLVLLGAGPVTEGASASLTAGNVTITGGGQAAASAITLGGGNHISNLAAESAGDITVNNAGPLTINTLNSPTSISVTTSAGDITVGRTIATFDGSNNTISGQTVTLDSAGNLSFASQLFPTGVTRAIGTLTLRAGGAITQSTGSLSANELSGSAASAALNQSGNAITDLGAFTTTGGFALSDASALTVTGPVTVGSGQTLALFSDSIALGTGGSLSAPAGTVALAPLTSGAAFALGSFVPSGGAIVADTLRVGSGTTGTITISGSFNLSAIATLDLESGAGITENGSGALQVTRVIGNADSATLDGANAIGTLGGFTTTGAFTLRNTQALTLAGPLQAGGVAALNVTGDLALAGDVTAPTLALTVSGAVTQTGGIVSTSSLTGTAGSANFASAGNQITGIGPFSTTGALSLTDASGLTVAGAVFAPTLTFDVGGNLDIAAPLGATSMTLRAGGAITGAQLTAGTLGGQAGSVSVTGGVGTLAGFTSTGGFSLNDTGTLTVTGPVTDLASIQLVTAGNLIASGGITAPNVALTANPASVGGGGAIDQIGGSINASTQLTLTAAGNVLQTGGIITAGALTGSANLVNLASLNQIGSVGPFQVVGQNLGDLAPNAFFLRNGQALAVTGNVSAASGNVVLDTSASPSGDVTVATAESTPGGNFVVYSGHDVTVGNDASVAAPNGAIFLEASYNANSPDATGAVNVNGALAATDVFIGAGSGGIRLAADVTASRYVALRGEGNVDPALIDQFRGPVTQVSGTISALNLSARGTSVSLTDANRVASLGLPQTSGDVENSTATVGDFSLSSAVPLTVASSVTVSTGHTISLASDSITIGAGGSLGAPGGTVAIAPLTQGGALSLGGFVPAGSIVADTLRVGSATTGPISIAGTFNLSAIGTLDLESGSTISESGSGSLQVSRLTGRAAGAVLDGPNVIGALAGFTATGGSTTAGGFTLRNTQSLTLSGPLQAASATLTVAGDLVVGASLSASSVSLVATGAITQTGGTITAAALGGSAGGGIALTASGNAITRVGSLSAGAPLSLTDGLGLTVSGPVSAPSATLTVAGGLTLDSSVTVPGALTMNAAGAITQTSGTLTAGTLTGAASGLVQLGVGGVADVGTLGSAVLTGNSALTLVNSVPLTVAGPLVAGTITLSAPGALTLAGGQITTDNATLSVSSPQNGAANLVQNGTTTVTAQTGGTGTLTLQLPASGGSLTLADLQASAMNLVLNLGNGQASGNLTAAGLQVVGSGGGAALNGSVAGQVGFPAAAVSAISPALDLAYTLNGCAISASTCGGGGGGDGGGGGGARGGDGTEIEPGLFLFPDSAIAVQTPRSFLGTELGNILKTDLFTADLITIGIIRDPADPELLLPNISDRDY